MVKKNAKKASEPKPTQAGLKKVGMKLLPTKRTNVISPEGGLTPLSYWEEQLEESAGITSGRDFLWVKHFALFDMVCMKCGRVRDLMLGEIRDRNGTLFEVRSSYHSETGAEWWQCESGCNRG